MDHTAAYERRKAEPRLKARVAVFVCSCSVNQRRNEPLKLQHLAYIGILEARVPFSYSMSPHASDTEDIEQTSSNPNDKSHHSSAPPTHHDVRHHCLSPVIGLPLSSQTTFTPLQPPIHSLVHPALTMLGGVLSFLSSSSSSVPLSLSREVLFRRNMGVACAIPRTLDPNGCF